MSRETVLVLGGTSGIGRALAAELAASGHDLIVAGRDAGEAEAIAADLRVRHGVTATALPFDLCDRDSHAAVVRRALEVAGDAPLGVVLSAGYLGEQRDAERNAEQLARILDTNFAAPVALLEGLAERLEARRAGWICIISSVAGDRGRQSNYLYGAAKAGLSAYAQGLRNRLFRAGVHVVLVKPGFVDTGMTFGRPGVRGAAAPERIAREIRQAIARKRDTVYLPNIWRPIMAVIRAIPEPIFKRLRL